MSAVIVDVANVVVLGPLAVLCVIAVIYFSRFKGALAYRRRQRIRQRQREEFWGYE